MTPNPGLPGVYRETLTDEMIREFAKPSYYKLTADRVRQRRCQCCGGPANTELPCRHFACELCDGSFKHPHPCIACALAM